MQMAVLTRTKRSRRWRALRTVGALMVVPALLIMMSITLRAFRHIPIAVHVCGFWLSRNPHPQTYLQSWHQKVITRYALSLNPEEPLALSLCGPPVCQ